MDTLDKPVSLHKADKGDNEYMLFVSDETDSFDYFTAPLTNRAMLDIIGKAYKLGYSDNFVIGVSVINMVQPRNVIVVKSDKSGQLHIDWDIVRKLDKSEWTA